jgi:hypothetical protein
VGSENPQHCEDVTLVRLERALAAISYAILLDGPIYAPFMERLEREIAAMRAKEDAVSRARQYLERLRNQAAVASNTGGDYISISAEIAIGGPRKKPIITERAS